MATKEIEIDGVKLNISEEIMDDVTVLELLEEIETRPSAILSFIKYALGDDGYKTMKAHYVEKNGRMRIEDIGTVATAISNAFPKA